MNQHNKQTTYWTAAALALKFLNDFFVLKMRHFVSMSGWDTEKLTWCGTFIYVAYAQSHHAFHKLGSISTSDVCDHISGIKTITLGLLYTV